MAAYHVTMKAHPHGCDECDQIAERAIEHATDMCASAARLGGETDHYARVERSPLPSPTHI